jgi:hypothetical protein
MACLGPAHELVFKGLVVEIAGQLDGDEFHRSGSMR